jgi:hypothetical protein
MTEPCPICLFDILHPIWGQKREADASRKSRIAERKELGKLNIAATDEINEEDAAAAGFSDLTPWDFAVEFIARRVNFPEDKIGGELQKWVAHPLGTKAPPARRAVKEFKRLDRRGDTLTLLRLLHSNFPTLASIWPPIMLPVVTAIGPSQTPKPKAEGGRSRGRHTLDDKTFATYEALIQAYKAWKEANPYEIKQVFVNGRPDGEQLAAAMAYMRSPMGKARAAAKKMPAKEICQVST